MAEKLKDKSVKIKKYEKNYHNKTQKLKGEKELKINNNPKQTIKKNRVKNGNVHKTKMENNFFLNFQNKFF